MKPIARTLGTTALLAAVAAAPAAVPAASAAPLQFTANGIYDATVPVSTFTAPNATWSISFILDSTPAVILPELGQFFGVPYSHFALTLGGAVLPLLPVSIGFYNNVTNSGGVDLFFNALADPAQGFEFYGPQAYTGDEFNPTMVPGVYDTFLPGNAGFAVLVNGTRVGLGESQFVIAAIPLPSALGLSLAGLALLGLAARRQRR